MYMMMASHQKERIEAFLHPDDPTYKGNYQVMQSMIAIGSGGLTGKGLYNGTQNQEGFLPVQESDFIFAVIGEELGVIGMLVVILLYTLFLLRMIILSRESERFLWNSYSNWSYEYVCLSDYSKYRYDCGCNSSNWSNTSVYKLWW